MSKSQIDPARIEQAMDALLRAVIENEDRLTAAGHTRAIYIVAATETGQDDVISEDVEGIIADPIGVACRSELAALGSLMFETLGTTDEIGDVLERVAGMDGGQVVRRRAVLEEAWQHVGAEGDLD